MRKCAVEGHAQRPLVVDGDRSRAAPGRDRLSDYARSPQTFRYLVTQKNTLIINAAHIVELMEIPD